MMRFYLAQHGDAVSKDIDPDRPLSTVGQQDVRRVAAFLANAGVRVHRVLHSGKTRARQTAEILGEAVFNGASVPVEAIAAIAPKDSVEAFAETLAPGRQDTMIVGHLPFMARLVAMLLTADAELELVAYQPGSLVCLERLESGSWRLNWMLRPELLPAAD